MRSALAKEIVQQGLARAGERRRGTGRVFLRMTATLAAEQAIPDFSKLPVQPDESGGVIQEGDGSFLFHLGYSDLGGSDHLG